MANGQPGFGDSLFKLASQRQAALSAEQARKSNQDNLRRKDINTLSGFDAASIEGDQQRAIFEEAVADVQSYISGTGEYEDAQYDPVNFKKQLMKINSVYNGFKAHGAGDVETAREALYNDAYTAGGVAREGGELGTNLMSNNNPSSYDEAVANHNNYFETARTANGKTMFDENGHPMGYPVVDGEVDRSAAPVSLFKMNAYANPESFRGNTVEVPAATTLDMVQGEKYVATLNRINESLEGVEGKPLREVHDIAVSKLFDDKFSSAGQSEFRETLLIDLVREGKFPSDDKELQQAFINGEFDNEDLIKLIPGVRRDAEKIYADRSFDVAAQSTQAKTRSGASGLGSEDSPYSNVADRGITGPENQGESTFWQQNILTEPIDLTGLYNAETGDMGGNASLIGVGVNSSGDRVVTVSTMSVVPDPEKYDTNGTMELTRSKDIVIKPGDQYYETLAIQDDKRIITDLEKRYKEKGLEIEASEIKKEEDRAIAIKVIKDANPEMTDAEAAKILDAGGQEAYDLEQRKIEIQPKIEEARDLLSGFDSKAFLEKYISQGMSPERAKLQVERDRKEARNIGADKMLLEGLPQEERDQLLEDLDNFEQSDDPNAPPGITVAEMASIKIKRLAADAKNAPVEGDLDKDGQVGLKEGDEGYVPFGEPGHGYNEYEAIDPYNGETVKGYEAYWLEVVKGQPGFQEPERFRLQREDKKKAEEKQEITSKPIEEVTPEAQAEYDATQEKLRLEERERLKALEAAGDPDAVEQEGEAPEYEISEAAANIVNTTISANEGYTPELQINVPDSLNSGVTIAGLDLGIEAGGADGKIEILSNYLTPQDVQALNTIKGKVGKDAQQALAEVQAKGLLTNESMGLTQQQLNEISARHLDIVLPSLYKAVGGEDKFSSLPDDLQSYIADVQFMTPGPTTLKSIKKALASNSKSDWEAVLNNYENYYGSEESLSKKIKEDKIKESNLRRVKKAATAVENYIKTLA